jgi:ParB family transcriptional regulator, chromosome partitioning protein
MTQSKLAMTYEPVGALAPNPWNTNRITDPVNEEKLRESLRRFGAFKPILVRTLPDGTLQILGGEHRWKAAQQLGYKEVPVVNLGALDEQRAKEIGLVDNGRYGEDDTLGLSNLIKELGTDIMSFMPFTELDLEALAKVSSINLEDLDKTPQEQLPDLNKLPSAPSSQVMRFKVPVEDMGWLSTMIEQEMKNQGYKEEDALTNAGHAFVSLMKRIKKT